MNFKYILLSYTNFRSDIVHEIIVHEIPILFSFIDILEDTNKLLPSKTNTKYLHTLFSDQEYDCKFLMTFMLLKFFCKIQENV